MALENSDSQGSATQPRVSFTTTVTAVSGLENQTVVNVYPNPFQNDIYIDLAEAPIPKPYFLYNGHGKIIQTGFLSAGINVIHANQPSLGMYFLKIEGKHSPLKLIKE